MNFFSNCLKSCDNLNNLLEVGSNIGMNLFALKSLLPNAKTSAVEINSIAAKALKQKLPECDVFNGSFLDYQCDGSFYLVFTKGVLIHFSPDVLPSVYRKMYELSSRYILICNILIQFPFSIEYGGFKDKLFKGFLQGFNGSFWISWIMGLRTNTMKILHEISAGLFEKASA